MGELPSGTVTFLFTDIEGSTRLWEEHPDAMEGALARHDEIVVAAVEAGGGVVFKNTGDGVCAAFASPAGALSAAVGAQQALGEAEWGDVGVLRARMGVHTGEATAVDGDYHGPPLNKVSRLHAAGYGDQVLVSGATAEVLGGALPDGVGLEDLGEHRLRDLAEPMRVWQVVHEALEGDFAPIRTLTNLRGNLPQQVTSFVGRADDVAALATTLAENRLITLTGVGGVGKTRLALHAAAEAAPRFPEGVWLAELAPVVDPEGIAYTMAGDLGLQLPDGQPAEGALVEALGSRRLLVVLDNCEHLLDGVGRLVEAIGRSCPDVTTIATSREPLAVPGERVWPVRSLAVPDTGADAVESAAVALFVERALAVSPEFALTADTSPVVADICRRLDGLPLAIELAAARTPSMGLGEISERLDERFRLLTGGRRTAVERHQTLRGAVDWSYRLLSEAERQLFAHLSVFSGAFTLGAAERVGAGGDVDEADVVDLVAALVDKSMVIAKIDDGTVRYRLLETLRQYGQERLYDAGATEEVRLRHAEWVLAFAEASAEGLWTPDEAAHRTRLKADLDNLRAAHAWALSAGDVELAARLVAGDLGFGIGPEFRAMAESTLEVLPPGSHSWAAAVHAVAANTALQRGDPDRATELAALGLTEQEVGLAAGVCRSVSAQVLYREGPTAEADRFCDEWIETTRSHPAMLAMALYLSALFGYYYGDKERARSLAREAMEAATHVGAPTLIAWAVHALGEVSAETDPDRALEHYDQAVDIARSVGNTFIESLAVMASSALRGRHGDPYQSLPAFREILEDWHERGDLERLWVATRNLVELLVRVGEDEAAAVLHGALEPTHGARMTESQASGIAELEHRMGEPTFQAALERGRAFDRSETLAYALEVIDDLMASAAT